MRNLFHFRRLPLISENLSPPKTELKLYLVSVRLGISPTTPCWVVFTAYPEANESKLIMCVPALQQSAFALCVFGAALLVPAGWILHHVPEYRQRSTP
uniref:Uncharacterized protein n=1 Tax=Poecilia latipinna TaxID=48699 RepID=A0A3B3TNT8_9TELE